MLRNSPQEYNLRFFVRQFKTELSDDFYRNLASIQQPLWCFETAATEKSTN